MKFLILPLALMSNFALALGPVTFGPEFTFTNPMQGNSDYEAVIRRMTEHLVLGQRRKAKFTVEDGNQFHSPNGWWFEVKTEGNDAGGVIEVDMSPMTVQEFRKYKNDIQDAIFASAANENYFPALFRGGGHINVGISAFTKNPLLARNFVVDLINHNELFMGILNYDTNNAIPFQMLEKGAQDAIYDRIAAFDKQILANKGALGDLEINEFFLSLRNIFADASDPFRGEWSGASRGYKYNAVAFHHVDMSNTSRIEIRGVRPQASMDMWVRQIDLIKHRLRYLEKMDRRLPIDWKVPVQKINIRKHLLNPPVDPQLALRAFYQYVTKSGLRWQDHRDYLWPNWTTGGELTKFEQSRWFATSERRNRCERRLAAE